MKKVIIICILLLGFAGLQAQSLFKPITKADLIKTSSLVGQPVNASGFFVRISTSVIATEFAWNTGTKQFDQSVFSKIGIGGSYAHYSMVNDQPFNDYSFNAFVFFPTTSPFTSVSIAGTVSAVNVLNLGKLNVGAGYDFGIKRIFALTGIVYTF